MNRMYHADLPQDKGHIFVFGSNLAGRHGKGAALFAKQHYAAAYGTGVGPTGYAYAIPTKDATLKVLPLYQIERHIGDFLRYARIHWDELFMVTALGTGLSGYQHSEIAPMFMLAPANCYFPHEWEPYL